MSVNNRTRSIGPANGQVTVQTYVGGIGAKIGHDLVLQATRWEGSLTLHDVDVGAASVEVTIEGTSLEVVKATGGLKPLSDRDRADISINQRKTLRTDAFPQITFHSTMVSGGLPSLSVEGDLTIAGETKQLILDVTVEVSSTDTTVTARTRLRQTDFGIKPYSKFGALKVKDEVDIQIVLTLPPA